MIKTRVLGPIILLVSLAGISCGGEDPNSVRVSLSDEQLIRQMHDARTDYYNSDNLAGLMETYSDEAVVLSGTLQVANGLDAIQELIGEEMLQAQGIQNNLKATLIFGSHAVLWGEYQWSGINSEDGSEMVTSGPYMMEVIQEGETWKVSREMWTQDTEIQGLEWDVIPEEFVENSEWSDEMDLLETLYNRRSPELMAELFSENALVGMPNFPTLEERGDVETFFQNVFDDTSETTMDVSVRSATILDGENVTLTGYLKTDGLATSPFEGRSRFLLLLELANPFEVDAGEDAEWQIRWMIASGQALFPF